MKQKILTKIKVYKNSFQYFDNFILDGASTPEKKLREIRWKWRELKAGENGEFFSSFLLVSFTLLTGYQMNIKHFWKFLIVQ